MIRIFGQQRGASVPEIGPAEARALLDDGALALDVREPDEYASGHVPGARHLPLGALANGLATLPRERTIVVICRSGRRSAQAVAALQAAGRNRAVNLAGGMMAWQRAGLPLEE